MVSQHKELPATFSSPALTTSATAKRRLEHARRTGQLHTSAVGVIAVWRDALAIFNTHSAAILLCASIGIAAPVIVTKAIDTLAKLSAYARAESAVAIAAIYDAPALSTMLAGAITGLLGLTLARGIITWIALQGSVHGLPPCEAGKTRGSFGEAICVTIANFPALLVGTLVYGLLLTACIIGLSALSQRLEYTRDRALHNWAGLSSAASDGISQLRWRAFNTLIPNPGPPFVELMPSLRHVVTVAPTAWRAKIVRVEDVISAYSSSHTYEPAELNASSRAVYPGLMTSSASHAFALGSVALILLVATLLRFRTIMALNPPGSCPPQPVGLLAPLIASARFGLRHFGRITIHVWVVRLAILALILVLIEFPLAITDHLVVPNALRFPIPLEIVPILDFLTTSGAALVSAILIAFSGVYDARLYHSLTNGYGKEQMFASGELPARNYA